MSIGFAQALQDGDFNRASMILNQIEWNQEAINSLESIYQRGAQATACSVRVYVLVVNIYEPIIIDLLLQ